MKLSKELNFVFFILALCFVNSHQQQQQPRQNHQQRHHARRIQQQSKVRRIYAMCPPSFTKIGNECYHLSSAKASWLDSHFECKDKNAKLAEPLKYSDRLLRKYLMQRGRTRGDIWIGGMYNWQRNKWQWGYNGKDMTYQSFSQMNPGADLKYHCSTLNPDLKYRWSAKLCFEKHYYLCQHRMPYVSEKNRQRIYTKWNETFPGQMANEIQVYVTSSNGNRREMQQRNGNNSRRPPSTAQQKRPQQQNQTMKNQGVQSNNQLPTDTRRLSNEINPPEILSMQDTQLRRKKQQKDKSKETKSLRLTGDVDLGKNLLKKSKQSKNRKANERRLSIMTSTISSTTTTTTTESPNAISQNFQPNHHRHNHYSTDNDDNSRRNAESRREDVFRSQQPSTTAPKSENTAAESIASKQNEKKKRLESIREKLSRLSDEEKMEYLKLKAQKKAMRSKTNNDTIP